MNIILQHFKLMDSHKEKYGKIEENELPWLVQKSSLNIKHYAESLGAEYKMLGGEPFRSGLRAQCQKLAALNEEYDHYDKVVVLDTDKFMVKGCDKNVFEAKGIACFDEIHRTQTLPRMYRQFPYWCNMNVPIYSGACWVFDREFRIKMREQIDSEMERMMKKVSPTIFVDEGIIHCLMTKAGMQPYKYLDRRWDYSSYLPDLDKAYMIHIRHRPKSREETYLDLVEQGIIEDYDA